MRSIFRYPGGKTRSTIQRWILSYMPEDVQEYREPFVGGGGIFFDLNRKGLDRWINDVNEGLVSVYRALAERPTEFIARCKAVAPASPDDPQTEAGVKNGKPQNARLKEVFDRVALSTVGDQAFRYFFVNRTVFGGRVNYDRPSRLYFSKPAGWDVVKGNDLDRAAEWVKGARISCGDFEPLFLEPGEKVWVYADPPYYRNTGFTGNSKLYQHSFTLEDHKRLAGVVRRCPHKVCLSYDDDPGEFVRSLYPEEEGFFWVWRRWAYCGSTNKTKDIGREVLILNYEPPGFLTTSQQQPESLTVDECGELARLEAEIDMALDSFRTAGHNLRLIRDRGLYRAEYQTFEDYCHGRWALSRIHAHRLIEAAAVIEIIQTLPTGNNQKIRERQARELTRLRDEDGNLDEEAIREAWAQAEARAREVSPGKPVVTAEIVAEVVDARSQAGKGTALPSPHRLLEQIRLLGGQIRLLSERDRCWLLESVHSEGLLTFEELHHGNGETVQERVAHPA